MRQKLVVLVVLSALFLSAGVAQADVGDTPAEDAPFGDEVSDVATEHGENVTDAVEDEEADVEDVAQTLGERISAIAQALL